MKDEPKKSLASLFGGKGAEDEEEDATDDEGDASTDAGQAVLDAIKAGDPDALASAIADLVSITGG